MVTELEKIALQIAIVVAPKPVGGKAYVPTDLIDKLRAETERLGFDWRGGHEELKRTLKEDATAADHPT